MQFQTFAGIDVSKATLDVFIRESKSHCIFSNSAKGFKQMLGWLKIQGCNVQHTLFCFEHTGLSSLPLSLFLSAHALAFVQVPGLAVKRSMGLQRGKSDCIDAAALSRYAYLYREQLILSTPLDKDLVRLKQLLALRNRMVRQKAAYIANVKELGALLMLPSTDSLISTQVDMIHRLSQQVAGLEKEMLQIVNANTALKQNMELATSVKGIGSQTALTMLVVTGNFTLFANARSFACYCGIAPFEHQSGSSYRGRTRVSHMANKQVKTLLSNAAATAIQYNAEMKIYYTRRLQEGKNKMSTLNIIRNKLVARVFAAVTRKQPYVDTFKFAA